jgi:chromosome segregation ATPase
MDQPGNGGNIKKSDNRAEKGYKKNTIILIAAVVGILLLSGGGAVYYFLNNGYDRIGQLESEKTELTQQLIAHDSLVTAWMQSMMVIEEDLRALQGKEQSLIEKSNDPELTPDIREIILAEIQDINTLLEDNKARISDLNNKLRKSGITIAALNDNVTTLEATLALRDSSLNLLKMDLAEKEFKLTELNGVVDSLNEDIDAYHEDITAYEQMVDAQFAELNKAYVATGSAKELEEKGLITREGGFLGLGKSKTLEPDLNEEPFEKVVITETQRIMLNAKKAELISEHPTTSYELVENDTLVSYLEIKNPEEFWKISRYAVVETKK